MQHQLINDMYSVIFDYLDFYSKVSYAVYLKDLSTVNFMSKITHPSTDDICALFEYGIECIKFIKSVYTINIWYILETYIKYFCCTETLKQLIKLYNHKQYKRLIDWCIIYQNFQILKFIHNDYNTHCDLMTCEELRYRHHIFKKMMSPLNCQECMNTFDVYNGYAEVITFTNSVSNKSETKCVCNNCKYPKRIIRHKVPSEPTNHRDKRQIIPYDHKYYENLYENSYKND